MYTYVTPDKKIRVGSVPPAGVRIRARPWGPDQPEIDQAPWGAVRRAAAMPKAAPRAASGVAQPRPSAASQSTVMPITTAPAKRDRTESAQPADKRARIMPVNAIETLDATWRAPDAHGMDDVDCILKV